MFGDIKKQKCKFVPLKAITDVCSGGTPDRSNKDYWQQGTIPWIKTTELQWNILNDSEEHITKSGLENSSAKIVPAGTILIAMYGQGKTRGMSSLLGKESSTNQACACVLPTNKINMKFLWQYYICSYESLRSLAKGSNQANLNAGMIKDYLVPIPDIDLQERFVEFVEQSDKSKYVAGEATTKAKNIVYYK